MAPVHENTFVSPAAQTVPKRIIVCCDGTWQSSTSLDPQHAIPSNVTRLCRVLAKAGEDKDKKTWQQIVYYDAGVGTGDLTDFEKGRQGGFGVGLVENVIEAYNFIVNNYAPGDELFFFGFSRGAYTVRSVAGLVGGLGVLSPVSMPHFAKIYNLYQSRETTMPFDEFPEWINWYQNPENLFHKEKALRKHVPIQVIGVWDTVGSLGIPDLHGLDLTGFRKSHQFHDTGLSPDIKNAYHALALDERREAFSPALWFLPKGQKSSINLCQVWFPGVHINCGGGDSEGEGEREELANITFAWMLDRIQPHLALDWDAVEAQLLVMEKLADSGKAGKTGYATGPIRDNYTGIYKLLGAPEDRTPGRYHDREKTNTFEYIHPSVHFRQEALRSSKNPYNPPALKGWKREYVQPADPEERKGWVWRKRHENDKVDQLWDFEIGHMPKERSVERRLIEGSWAENLLKEVDEQWKNYK